MIEKERIEAVKSASDIVAVMESRGVLLKKNGKSLMGLCPFHEDTKPSLSVTPEKGVWKCFGCDAGGDVYRFVELYDQIEFPQAFEILAGEVMINASTEKPAPVKKAPKKPSPEPAKPLSVKDQKLLTRVITFYQHTMGDDPRGMDYLKKERGINERKSVKDFGAGFVNGKLLSILPQDDQIIADLKRIGILNDKGNERFYNCVVFPLYDKNGGAVGIYARNIDPDCDLTHLYLPGPRTGVINRQAVNRSQTVILTESVIDALTLYDQGFTNTIPLYGTNGLADDHLFLFKGKIKRVYIVFDADEAGKKGAEAVSSRLKKEKIAAFIVKLPVKDVNVYFKRHTPEEFEALLKESDPDSLEQSDKVSKRKQTLYKEVEHGFIVGYAERQYHVKGIRRTETQLKVTVKASTDVEGSAPFELSTIDLYSSKSRTWFAKMCAALFEASEELVKEDMGKLLSLVENFKPGEEKPQVEEPTEAEKTEAMRFLKNPQIFDEILADFETMGITGEETNKLVGYLAAISRKLSEPLSVLIQSRSAAGKSTLQDAILSLVPKEDFFKYTRITDQALFYKEKESMVNKILAIEEDAGMGGAAYPIRNIQSSGQITVATTGKDPSTGKMRTEEHTVDGPVAVMVTTTAAEIDGETASRFLFLTIDESAEMTGAIHAMQRKAETLEGLIKSKKKENLIRKHHMAQRLLKKIAVANEYSKYLSYPNQSLRTRRDHKKYLGLIRTIAFLHQYQRKTKTVTVDGEPMEVVEVTLGDIDRANQLANEVLGQSLDEIARPSRTLLSLVFKMVKEEAERKDKAIDEIYFTRRTIREYTGWSDWQVKTHIKQLEQMEYLHVRVGAKGKQYAYGLNYQGQGEDKRRFYLNLTPVSEIKKMMKGGKRGKSTN